jgi:hypothetical protein
VIQWMIQSCCSLLLSLKRYRLKTRLRGSLAKLEEKPEVTASEVRSDANRERRTSLAAARSQHSRLVEAARKLQTRVW